MAELKLYRFGHSTENRALCRALCYLAANDIAEAWEKFREQYEGVYGKHTCQINFPCEEVNERLEGFKITLTPLEQTVSS